MQEIFNFIKEYWELIVGILSLIIAVIVSAIRKKPVNDIVSTIYDFSIESVLLSEKYRQGQPSSSKLMYALDRVKEMLKLKYPDLDLGIYNNTIIRVIEKILTTPQKKGE